ncbi:hypothetical protein DL98DRAFT_631152 [Cadophora sp. DSE1049]|nr:hypothetical protein DL98DRAFT_631152 [Cadophora sp. DSE1049]
MQPQNDDDAQPWNCIPDLNQIAGSNIACENLAQAGHGDRLAIVTGRVPNPNQNNASATTTPPVNRLNPLSKQLWTVDTIPLSKSSSVDFSNIANIQAHRLRAQALQPHPSKSFLATAQALRHPRSLQSGPTILGRNTSFQSLPTQGDNYDILMQPGTRPISQEQLVAEVKGIYAGLVMVEAKCIEVDNKQVILAQADPTSQTKLNNEQWQALIALHRTLLHEHHDFFLASQHPSASPALRRLASKYAMPARMWRHGIHSYRMAIEDDDTRDREVWTGVARHWYSKASKKAPTAGRLYHHLAILARPNALQQLFYYAKSLCVRIPFTSARDSILTLFEPVLNSDNDRNQYRLQSLDAAFIKAHGLLFTNRDIENFDLTIKQFLDLLDNYIGRVTRGFMKRGYYIAIANSVAMLGFASKDNPVIQATIESPAGESDVDMAGDNSPAMKSFQRAKHLSNKTVEIVLQRIGDPNVLPFIHVTMVLMYHLARHPRAMKLLRASFPWQSLAVMLNTLLAPYQTPARIESTDFPLPIKDNVRPFPDDFAMRGLLWADGYYPEKWFANDKIDVSEKYLESASMTDERKERILWLACRIASLGGWLQYHNESKRFSVPSSNT